MRLLSLHRKNSWLYALPVSAGLILGTQVLGGAQVAYAQADQTQKPSVETLQKTAEEKLNTLFDDLKRERSEGKAKRIADRIWKAWFDSGSPTVDLLMVSAQTAVQSQSWALALDLLDQIVLLEPGFAEGWNRRATLHFMLRDTAKSIRDIEKTLALEPRHFGALAGLGGILRSEGEKERALEIYLKVLDIYPMQRSAQKAVVELSEELTAQKL